MRLEVERFSYGPDSIAHAPDGRVVFVSGAVPGDIVEAQVTKETTRSLKAACTQVLEPSPYRVKSRCPYSEVCGGCPWASASYDFQLSAKRKNVVSSLVRIGRFGQEHAQRLAAPAQSCGDSWGYRNKIELAVGHQGQRTIVGMHPAKGTAPIKVDRCLLLDPVAEKLVKGVSGALSYVASSHQLELERVGIRASRRTRDIEVALWTSPGAFPRAHMAKVLGDAAKPTSVVRVLSKGPQKARKVSGVEVLSGTGSWSERILDETLRVSAPSFFQVNTKGADKLVNLVLEGLNPCEDDLAMDLYSGAGTFTIPLARRCAFVDAVESYGPAVRDLRRNLEMNSIDNGDPVGGDADREFPDSEADVIVVDPPRAGLAASVVEKLSRQPARAIAYVSCDPATLARDLERFGAQGVFEPVSVTPVDLFPQTFHIETVTILKRRG
ncbi:23S rRNA (uracil(1939)-C(5))-methyltransferase RlmD [Olsenella sp. KGMB02461]|nr:23S rRNA (uracil(1939)-C(5))-methyltransferase RlmD [Olsenella sp. KGMB02461]